MAENAIEGYVQMMENLVLHHIPIVGITGPPGAGKSTLLNALMGYLLDAGKKIGLVLVDPSSPFNFGAVLGDRLRMSSYFTHPHLFIRSVATRGSLGGLSDTILEVTEVMKSFPFDMIFVETVGVGQSEVEIAGLADTTVVTLVPEAGDSIQNMKAGIMEIADVFVINKADRAGADAIFNSLQLQLHLHGRDHIPVLKTVAVEGQGINELLRVIDARKDESAADRKLHLLTEKCLRLIQKKRMKDFDVAKMQQALRTALNTNEFSLYKFLRAYN